MHDPPTVAVEPIEAKSVVAPQNAPTVEYRAKVISADFEGTVLRAFGRRMASFGTFASLEALTPGAPTESHNG